MFLVYKKSAFSARFLFGRAVMREKMAGQTGPGPLPRKKQHTLLLQRNLAMQSLCFPLKSEALNPKSETISNVRNPNLRNKNTDWPTVVV